MSDDLPRVHVEGFIHGLNGPHSMNVFVTEFGVGPDSDLSVIREIMAQRTGVQINNIQILALDEHTDWYVDPYGRQWDVNAL